MKKNILLFILALTTTLGFSQDKEERIKALKVALITEKLNLSETEAQNFWPIYNTFEDNNRDLRGSIYEKRKQTDVETLTEEEAKALLKETTDLADKRHKLFTKYMQDLQKVLPAKKIILLKQAEDDFKHKIFEEYKKRRLQP